MTENKSSNVVVNLDKTIVKSKDMTEPMDHEVSSLIQKDSFFFLRIQPFNC